MWHEDYSLKLHAVSVTIRWFCVMIVLFDSLAVSVRGSSAFLLTTTYHYTGVVHYSFYYLTHDSSISSSFMILATLNLTFRNASVKHVVELGYALLFLLVFLIASSALLWSALLCSTISLLFSFTLHLHSELRLLFWLTTWTVLSLHFAGVMF